MLKRSSLKLSGRKRRRLSCSMLKRCMLKRHGVGRRPCRVRRRPNRSRRQEYNVIIIIIVVVVVVVAVVVYSLGLDSNLLLCRA